MKWMNEMLQRRGKQTCSLYVIHQMLTVSTDIRIQGWCPWQLLVVHLLAWQKTLIFVMLPLVSLQNGVWETSRESPYWWRVTTGVTSCPDLGSPSGWLKILFASTNQKKYPDLGSDASSYGISAFISLTSFYRETCGGVTKCWLVSQAIH